MGGEANTSQFIYEHVGCPPEISVEQVSDVSQGLRLMDETYLNQVGAIFENGTANALLLV